MPRFTADEWSTYVAETHAKPLKRKRCCAIKADGTRCKTYVVTGRDYCKFHGGLAPAGIRSPWLTTGRYTKHIPADLQERYEESISDPKIMELRDEIGLIDARLAQLLRALGAGETSSHWGMLGQTWGQFMLAVRTGNQAKQKSLLPYINDLIVQGASTAEEWNQLADLVERRRKLVETEQKRVISNAQMVPVDDVIAMLRMVVESTKYAANKYLDAQTAKAVIDSAAEAYERLVGVRPDTSGSGVVVEGRLARRVP